MSCDGFWRVGVAEPASACSKKLVPVLTRQILLEEQSFHLKETAVLSCADFVDRLKIGPDQTRDKRRLFSTRRGRLFGSKLGTVGVEESSPRTVHVCRPDTK